MYKVLKLNKIATEGINSFPSENYIVGDDISDPDAIILRSFDMHAMVIPSSLKAVGRAGSGVNNIPIKKLSDLAIPVFNAPGANSNAVKELVIAAILISARNIHQAIGLVEKEDSPQDFKQRIEHGKNKYVGYELPGKTIGVIGLGAIGVKVANACLNLGMNVIGFDPMMTLDNAWELQPGIENSNNLSDLLRKADVNALVIDIIDQHGIFHRQWLKRRAFYKKSKFEILLTNNKDYGNNKWHSFKVKRKKKKPLPFLIKD